MTAFALKLIAMITMLIDHIGVSFYPDQLWLRMIGRLAFPIFAFLVAEGAYYTRNRGQYLIRMGFFAVLSEVPFDMMVSGKYVDWGHQNVMWTFLIALSVIFLKDRFMEKGYHRAYIIFYSIFAILLAAYGKTDYGSLGVLMVLAGYYFQSDRKKQLLWLGLLLIGFGLNYTVMRWEMVWKAVGGDFTVLRQNWDRMSPYLFSWMDYFEALACFSLPLLMLYNGKRGINLKYFFYAFYPVHLFILGALAMKLW